jgi:hypothetical protein
MKLLDTSIWQKWLNQNYKITVRMKREIFVLVVIYLDDRTDLREEICHN